MRIPLDSGFANFGEFCESGRPIWRIRRVSANGAGWRPFQSKSVECSANVRRIFGEFSPNGMGPRVDPTTFAEFLRISSKFVESRRMAPSPPLNSPNIRRIFCELSSNLGEAQRISANFCEFRRIPSGTAWDCIGIRRISVNFGEFRRIPPAGAESASSFAEYSANVRPTFGEFR